MAVFDITSKNSMKTVGNKVSITTEHCSCVNLSRFGFQLGLKNQTNRKKLGTISTLDHTRFGTVWPQPHRALAKDLD